MASWQTIENDAPELATRVEACFASGVNKTIATIRKDSSPRISAIELKFTPTEVTLGMMGGSLKLRDVLRDPRVAIHSPTVEPPKENGGEWLGDAKLAGRLVRIASPANSPHADASFFRLDLTEVVLTYLGTPADHLVIESWSTGHGFRRRTRV